MVDPHEPTPEFAALEAIADAIRRALGDGVEACPGFRDPEQADPLNRAFRAVARRLLETRAASGRELIAFVSGALRTLVRRRLEAGGLDGLQIRTLLSLEPGTPDDWACFLILVPWAEVLFWLHAADVDPD